MSEQRWQHPDPHLYFGRSCLRHSPQPYGYVNSIEGTSFRLFEGSPAQEVSIIGSLLSLMEIPR